MEEYKQIGKRRLRMGYTTGSCAAAAAKAAAQMLFSGIPAGRVSLMTPKGIVLDLEVEDICFSDGMVSCAVRKDAGDDPDVTNGVLVYAAVSFREGAPGTDAFREWTAQRADAGRASQETGKIRIDGGTGIGRVTKKGLEQPVGSAAINRVPRQMIREAVLEICEEQEYDGCLDVTISIPAGVELAKKTFNPNLGIEGGISVLGTSGIVEPMSEAALKESIRIEMKMLAENYGKALILSPGNYGTHYVRSRWPAFAKGEIPCLKFSNYVGDALRFALETGLTSVLFVAHIGKFVKVAGGIMNTHSQEADARVEIMASAALRAGADAETARRILACTTTDAAIDVLQETDKENTLLGRTMQVLLEQALDHLRRRAADDLEIGLVLFSNAHGTLAESENTDRLLQEIAREVDCAENDIVKRAEI